ncbi:hypothetical protein K435DRAFT_580300, partial [Dendrothele bispora CBS 962.96]
NEEQKCIYDGVMDAIADEDHLLLYIDGKAGQGKTFLIRAICNHLRSVGKIVLATATS